MKKIINSVPFFYLLSLLFVSVSFLIGPKVTIQVVWWTLYIIINIYLPTVEKIKPSLPSLFPPVVFVTGGVTSPLMPLLFLSLPLTHSRYKAHYPYFSALSFVMLLLSGTISKPLHFLVYAVFVLSVGAVYLYFRTEWLSTLFSSGKEESAESASPDAIGDPFAPLKTYLKRMELWEKSVPVNIRIIELIFDEEKSEGQGRLFGTDHTFPLTGIIRVAIKNRQDIACTTILDEKENVPMMPQFNKRIYLPTNTFDPYLKNLDPEYIIVVDTVFEGDKQMLIEKFAPMKKDISELLKIGSTFGQVLLERKRKAKLYQGAKTLLESFNRNALFKNSAKVIFGMVPEADVLLFSDYTDGVHKGHIFERSNVEDRKGVAGNNREYIPVKSAPLGAQESIFNIFLDNKMGEYIERKDLAKRKTGEKLFPEAEFQPLNQFDRMSSFLLRKENASLGTLSLFFKGDEKLSKHSREDLNLLTRIISSAFQNIKMYEKVQELSNIDPLTTLYNRRYFTEQLERMVQEAGRSQRPLGIIMLDVDFFKRVNDNWGHKAGDDILRFMGKTLKNNTRKVDIVARYGGEEFVIILHNTDTEGSRNVAEKLREAIEKSYIMADGNQLNITSSFGVSSYPKSAQLPEQLVKTADTALYVSKEEGRNRVSVYTSDQ